MQAINSFQDSSYEEEKALVRYVQWRITNIMAHHSPVLIVQRYVRGWLVRRKYKSVQDTRIWYVMLVSSRKTHYEPSCL